MRQLPSILLLLATTFAGGATAAESSLEDCAKGDAQCLQRNYDRACAGESANGDVCLGLASMTDDEAERLRILRRVAEIAPNTFSLRILASELSQSGRQEDTLEAAQLMERAFSMSGHKWWYAARTAYFLYLEADEPKRAADLRELAQRQFPAKPLGRLPAGVTADAISDVLEPLCSHDALPVLGPSHCLNSIGAVVEHLAASSRNEHSQEIADAASVAMLAAAAGQRTLDTEAHDWRNRYQSWIESLLASGLDSVAVRRLRAHAEEDSWPIVVE